MVNGLNLGSSHECVSGRWISTVHIVLDADSCSPSPASCLLCAANLAPAHLPNTVAIHQPTDLLLHQFMLGATKLFLHASSGKCKMHEKKRVPRSPSFGVGRRRTRKQSMSRCRGMFHQPAPAQRHPTATWHGVCCVRRVILEGVGLV